MNKYIQILFQQKYQQHKQVQMDETHVQSPARSRRPAKKAQSTRRRNSPDRSSNEGAQRPLQLSNQIHRNVERASVFRKEEGGGMQLTLHQASMAQMRRPKVDVMQDGQGYHGGKARGGQFSVRSNSMFERFLKISKSSSQTTENWTAENVKFHDQNLTNIQTPDHYGRAQGNKRRDGQRPKMPGAMVSQHY